jgi:hypothetical protein
MLPSISMPLLLAMFFAALVLGLAAGQRFR